MKLSCPFSRRFGLDVFHLPASDSGTEEAIHNGKAREMITEVLISCYEGPEEILTKLKNKLLAIGLEGFSGAWAPGGDIHALIDFATFNGSMWITDDTFDDPNQDEEMNASLINAWSKIPKIVGEIYQTDTFQEENKNNTTEEKVQALYNKFIALYPEYVSSKKFPVIDCSNRMFIRSVAAARLKAGNDDVYDFFIDACKTWSTNSCSDFLGIRGKGYEQVSAEELRSWRSVNSGSIPAFAHAIAVHGIAISREMFERSEVRRLFHIAGQHVGTVNDVFSYDREISEEDGWTNYVQYLCLTTDKTVDESFSETIRQINCFTDEFVEITDDLILKTENAKERNMLWYLSYLAARGMVGTVTWSLLVDRYTRKEFVNSILSNDEQHPKIPEPVWFACAKENGMADRYRRANQTKSQGEENKDNESCASKCAKKQRIGDVPLPKQLLSVK